MTSGNMHRKVSSSVVEFVNLKQSQELKGFKEHELTVMQADSASPNGQLMEHQAEVQKKFCEAIGL